LAENISAVLLSEYGLKAFNITRFRGNYICKTDKGQKELRRAFADEKRIKFEYNVREKLFENGYESAERILPTLLGAPFCETDSGRFILTEYIPGEPPDQERPGDFLRCAEELGLLHRAAWGLEYEENAKGAANAEEIYEKRASELGRIRARLTKESRLSKVDMLVMEHYDYYMERVKRAKELLAASRYPLLLAEARLKKSFCHNSFKGEALKIAEKTGKFIVSGFGSCAYGCYAEDIAAFLRRYMKKPDAEASLIKKALDRYDRVRGLTGAEYNVVIAMLTYPQKFLRLVNEHYNKRRVYVSDALFERFEKCVAGAKREERLISELHKR